MEHLIRPENKNEFFTPEKCHILELVDSNTDKPFSIARARVEPGVTTSWHSLNETDEYYTILSGSGLMEINGNYKYEVVKGDIIYIPANSPQRITNTNISEDLVFYVLCSPAFKKENYIDLES